MNPKVVVCRVRGLGGWQDLGGMCNQSGMHERFEPKGRKGPTWNVVKQVAMILTQCYVLCKLVHVGHVMIFCLVREASRPR